ncbi:response regulator transcription factor [Aestuariibacter sp. A3R04]|uniref:response regulator transcription factor n=1 Tax=Aestuariibacter sp. A3R04 TaxID=2841571 RepID=UPI001C097C8D|nr:response regulator transcription factor [Aestuariibacter sp. A3R04]MBU3023816.1 response regulator transcription factor [Aestuariibacter sp. A3R04]
MSQSTLSVLLIEDNLALARQVSRFLEGLGWQLDFADKGKQGVTLALNHHYDVIILDLNLPDCDGLTVCQQIKEQQTRLTPVLMLTARDAFEDKAKGFTQGTDDYLTKPCDLRELALRCEALARRPQLHTATTLSKGGLKLDLKASVASWQDQQLKVTKVAFQILRELVNAYPQPVARSDLVATLWNDELPESNPLKSHMYNLRKALAQQAPEVQLVTIGNIGYQLQGLDNV